MTTDRTGAGARRRSDTHPGRAPSGATGRICDIPSEGVAHVADVGDVGDGRVNQWTGEAGAVAKRDVDLSRASTGDIGAGGGAGDVAPRRKLFEEVAKDLTGRILDGELRPGDKLPSERELMRVHRIGRPAVREAMQTLERAGLISISHGERARVLSPSAQDVIDQIEQSARHLIRRSPEHLEHLKSARAFFEVGVARMAAEGATDEDVADLRGLVEAQAETGDDAGFLRADMAFHVRLARITGNPIFSGLSQAIFEWLAEYHIELVHLPGAEALTVSEHARIADAVAGRDPEAAGDAMREHLRRANTLYRRFERAEGRSPDA